MNPYANNKLKYNLTRKELLLVDRAWELIYDLAETEISRYKYRKVVIDKIKNKYTEKEFYILETIIEKMYWNLEDKIKKTFDVNIHLYKKFGKFQLTNVVNQIYKKNKRVKESNIRKSYVYDVRKQEVLYKYNYPNELDLIVSSIIINRSTYETIMGDKADISNLQIEPYNNTIEYDYPYPNLNTIEPFAIDNKRRIQNIKNMYYSQNSELYWF